MLESVIAVRRSTLCIALCVPCFLRPDLNTYQNFNSNRRNWFKRRKRSHQEYLAAVLFSLEEGGLLRMNASSFKSSGGISFFSLHLQVIEIERTPKLETEALIEKLSSLYENKEEFLSSFKSDPSCFI
ncbi:transcription factor ORG2-like [Melia azedarach]|uniref:Transcription factor ORG2-like n=1 Tax=Melia azedarach TaxID=155640 RepID=A0ACC1X4K6_MELAZ|nr:transcription factor ORG2-like [Melia azedarach]